MADAAAAAPAKKTPKKKSTKPKKPAAHPTYKEMIAKALAALKDRKGSSNQAIRKYIVSNFKVDADKVGRHLKKALKSGTSSGSLVQTKGKGASGSFKLSEKKAAVKKPKAKKPKAAKKPAAKKVKKPKAAKPKAAKKPKAKKPAAKKAAKPKAAKPKAAKKPAAKKAKKSPKKAKAAKK